MPFDISITIRAWLGVGSAALISTLSGCGDDSVPPDPGQIASAESIIDAFYAWEPEPLSTRIATAKGVEATLYYQAWAEAAHYEISNRRSCRQAAIDVVECAITVTDDFGSALGYIATDTFRFEFSGPELRRIDFEGDDPLVFTAMFAWMALTRGEVFEDECRDMFEGGPTPGACAKAVAEAAREFAEVWPFR